MSMTTETFNKENFNPIRKLPNTQNYKKGDVLALYGELFQRGYANGLVDEAQKKQMTIVRSTVGRREHNALRGLTPDESAQIPTPFINIALEAGFDMEFVNETQTVNDLLKDTKMSEWSKIQIDFNLIEKAKLNARLRLLKNTKLWADELKKLIKPGQNLMIAHLMAGGVPRAKILMPVLNRVFKGVGDRFVDSKEFWHTPLGQLCAQNFIEVTAYSLQILIEATKDLQDYVVQNGGRVSFVAYGYHGTEIYLHDKLEWQSYAPYLQGWAKIELEKIATENFKKGLAVSVYNCPEILTNSSSIFQGVELPLYLLLRAIKKHAPKKYQAIESKCQGTLKPGVTLEQVTYLAEQLLSDAYIKEQYDISTWPCHSRKDQLEKTLHVSDKIIEMHTSEKELMTPFLSEVIFESCGHLMLNYGYKPDKSVYWIGHDAVATAFEKL